VRSTTSADSCPRWLLLLFSTAATERADYWQRLFSVRRIRPAWFAVIALLPALVVGLAAFGDVLLGGRGATLDAAARFRQQPLTLVPFTLFVLVFGPVPEEMGWRGYALDPLQARFSALNASLLLGTIWTVWHLPLFFVPGTYQQQLGLGTVAFWYFMADKIPQSILMTWIYNSTARSTLSAVLFHFMVNYLGELFALTPRAEGFSIVVWIFAALVATLAVGPRTLKSGGSKIH